MTEIEKLESVTKIARAEVVYTKDVGYGQISFDVDDFDTLLRAASAHLESMKAVERVMAKIDEADLIEGMHKN